MTDVFRLGLVGGGRMGQTHIRALAASTDVKIVAVAEPYEPAAEKLRATGLRVHSTVSDLLEAGDIDGVVIAVPTDQHLSLVELVARAHLPLLCEKPCGLSSAQAAQAGDIARQYGVPLQVAYWRRFIPALQDLRAKIAADEVGNVHFVSCTQWDQAPPATQFRTHSGGIFVDMGVHEIDQIRWLTGQEVSHVSAVAFPTVEDPGAKGDVDSAQALLTLSSGTAAMISLGRFHPEGDLVTAEVFGSRSHESVNVLLPSDGEEPQLEALRRQAAAFARYARSGSPEGATADDAAAALTIAERLSRAAGLQILGSDDR